MTVRPSAAYGYRECIDEIAAIADLVRTHPHGAYVKFVEAKVAPWERAWCGLALFAGDLSVLLPVIGEWPLGPGKSTRQVDLEAVMPVDLLPALTSLSRLIRGSIDPDNRFIDASESMRRLLKVALAYMATQQKAAFERLNLVDGVIMFKIGLEADGAPIVWIDTIEGMHRVYLPSKCMRDLMKEEPLLLYAGHHDDFGIEGGDLPSTVLNPLYDAYEGAASGGEMPSPMEILRTLDRWPSEDTTG